MRVKVADKNALVKFNLYVHIYLRVRVFTKLCNDVFKYILHRTRNSSKLRVNETINEIQPLKLK